MIFDDENQTPENGGNPPQGEEGSSTESDAAAGGEGKEAKGMDQSNLPEQGGSDLGEDLSEETPDDVAEALGAVYDVPIQVSAVLGTSKMRVSQLLKMGRGAVIELDRKVGEAVDVYVNNRLIARGEVVVVDDQLGITMTEIIKSDRFNAQKSK